MDFNVTFTNIRHKVYAQEGLIPRADNPLGCGGYFCEFCTQYAFEETVHVKLRLIQYDMGN